MKIRSFTIILVSILISAGNAWASPVTGKISYLKMDRHDDDRRSDERHDGMRDEFNYDEVIMSSDEDGDSKIVFEKAGLFREETWFTESFYIDTAGTYQAILTDFEFPNPLKYSGLNITTAKSSLGKLFGPGAFSFDAEPGKYYVSFFAKAGNGGDYRVPLLNMVMEEYGRYDNKLGQYGIEISMQPSAVPIPATAWLFGSGLLGLIGAAKRRKAPAV